MIATSNGKVAMQDFKEHEKSNRMIPPKDQNNLPVPDQKDMEIRDLPGKELKVNVLRKPNELQENREREFNKIRNK